MSKHKDEMSSDEEFQDALVEPETKESGINADNFLDEITQQQRDLKLTDDGDKSPANECGAAGTPNRDSPELIDDIIDEDELREREKTMSAEELLSNKEKADKMKLDGNELFKNKEPEKSVEIYTEALRICPTTYTKERAILYSNRAAAKAQMDACKSAIDDCTKAIELWPDYVRALLRRAKLYEQEDTLDSALEDYKRVNELDPGQPDAREALVRLPPIVNERNERLKEEMMSKLKDLGNMILKPFGLSTSNFQMQQDPNTGSYSINFNQNAGKQ